VHTAVGLVSGWFTHLVVAVMGHVAGGAPDVAGHLHVAPRAVYGPPLAGRGTVGVGEEAGGVEPLDRLEKPIRYESQYLISRYLSTINIRFRY
jgi:hypothetical protein